jgi:hypothetical protein
VILRIEIIFGTILYLLLAMWLKWGTIGKGKGTAIPLQAWTGPEGSRRLMLPDLKTIGAWRWQGCRPYVRAAFTPQELFMTLGTFMKILGNIPNLVTIGENCRALYIKTYVRFMVAGHIVSRYKRSLEWSGVWFFG